MDDKNEEEHIIGFLTKYEKPYWAGNCDIPNGCEFYSADELFHAKIFDGESICDRWDKIVFITLGGLDIDD